MLYKTDNAEVKVEILLQNENLWLTQAKMAELFDVQKAAISKHLKNIFAEGELQENSVVSKMETTAADGKNYNTNFRCQELPLSRRNQKSERNCYDVPGLCGTASEARAGDVHDHSFCDNYLLL